MSENVSSVEIDDIERIKRNKLNNINLLMAYNNISNYNALARVLGIGYTTLHSYLTTLSDKSKVESVICDYFNVTIYEFQNEDLSKNSYLLRKFNNNLRDDVPLNSIKSRDDSFISALSNEDIYNEILSSRNGKHNEKELEDLKNRLIHAYDMVYLTRISEARRNFALHKYDQSLACFDSAWAVMERRSLKSIKVSDFKDYIFASKKTGIVSGLEVLVNKLLGNELRDNKVILFLASCLEESFPEYARLCYMSLLEE